MITLRMVEIQDIDYDLFETLRDSIWKDPRTKFGCFSEGYSKKLKLARFWFYGAEYVPDRIGSFPFKKYMLLTPQLSGPFIID